MRVIIVSRGDFIHLDPFLEAMLLRDWDVHLASLSPWRFPRSGVTCHKCYLSQFKPLSYAYGAWRLRQLARRVQPDFVWAHYASSAGTAAWLSGVRPYCVTVHGSDVFDVSKRRLGRSVLRYVLDGANCVHTVSPQSAARVSELTFGDQGSITAPFGIDVDALPYREPSFRDPVRLVCTRSLQYTVYDIPTILKAVQLMNRRNQLVCLSLCGGGMLQHELENLAVKFDVRDQVDFMGGYAPKDLLSILHSHDIYISAALSDGASLSLMEAMSAGLFPVVSDIPANRDWLEDEMSFFPPGDAAALAERIASAIQKQYRLSERTWQNRAKVNQLGDRQRNLNRILDHLVNLSLDESNRITL